MIYLTTGANGAGKTLITLRDVRAQQLKENRPVYYHGFEMVPEKAVEFGWQKFDPKEWQQLPDGSICIMDECQNEFPLRRSGAEVPPYVQAIAQDRRKRGFDFWMICPHPSLLDVFVRRLIDKPSWHRHMKRAFGGDLVSELKFSAPDMKCEEPGAGSRGEVRMVPYPKEVYAWYRSASLHTGKKKIPRAVYVLGAIIVAVPLLGWFAFSKLPGSSKPKPDSVAAQAQATGSAVPVQKPAGPMTAKEYIASHVPRIEGLPHTAPRYDAVTAPTEAPYPAACIQSKRGCDCYSQQGTKLLTPVDLCRQILAGGFFMDWKGKENPTGHASGSAGSRAVQGQETASVASPGSSPGGSQRSAPVASASPWSFTGDPVPTQQVAQAEQDADVYRFMKRSR